VTDRRTFIAGLLATGLVPTLTWADAGSPAFVSAARRADGSFGLCGLSTTGQIVFECALPGRGHAAACHPIQPEVVAFARRPGTFAVVVNCVYRRESARLTAPDGRHFYGHGVFSGDGTLLYTTENDYDAARGMVGIWDVSRGYARMGEVPSGGVGPHDIRLMPDGQTLVVANGGIETHPDTGRTKLNLHAMRSNLSYLDALGQVADQLDLGELYRRHSIRHLAVGSDGRVAFAMQWQGDSAARPPVLGLHHRGGQSGLFDAGVQSRAEMRGYAGSVAIAPVGHAIAVTSPRGGVCQIFGKGAFQEHRLPDVCGVAGLNEGFMMTAGTGRVLYRDRDGMGWDVQHACAWDNHLISLPAI